MSTIHALNARIHRLDEILSFAREEDEDGNSLAGTAVGGAATGAGIVGGGYLAGRAIRRAQSVPLLGPGEIKAGSPRSINTRTVADGVTHGGTARRSAGAAARSVARGVGQSVGNVMRQTGTRISKIGRHISGRGRLFSAGTQGVIALAEKAGAGLVEFEGRELTPGDHYLRHVGGPLGVAATSKKGKRWDAFKESAADTAKNVAGGTAIGAGGGALVGAGVGLKRAMHGVGKGPKMGAIGGAIIGGGLGYIGGALRGTHGKRQRDIQRKYHAR